MNHRSCTEAGDYLVDGHRTEIIPPIVVPISVLASDRILLFHFLLFLALLILKGNKVRTTSRRDLSVTQCARPCIMASPWQPLKNKGTREIRNEPLQNDSSNKSHAMCEPISTFRARQRSGEDVVRGNARLKGCLESPFLLCPSKVCTENTWKPSVGREETDSPKHPLDDRFSARRLLRSFGAPQTCFPEWFTKKLAESEVDVYFIATSTLMQVHSPFGFAACTCSNVLTHVTLCVKKMAMMSLKTLSLLSLACLVSVVVDVTLVLVSLKVCFQWGRQTMFSQRTLSNSELRFISLRKLAENIHGFHCCVGLWIELQ